LILIEGLTINLKNVLLIFSNNKDSAVNKVCNWLNYYNIVYKRINDEFLMDMIHSIAKNAKAINNVIFFIFYILFKIIGKYKA
jgi:hypothetical protein